MKILSYSNSKFLCYIILFNIFYLIFSSLPIMSSDEEVDDLVNKVVDLKGLGKKTSRSVPSTPEDKHKPTKDPQSEPRVPKKYEFDVNLLRYHDKKKAGVYFSKTATLKCSGVDVSFSNNDGIFGDNSHLKAMDDFLIKQVQVGGTDGWKRNHLSANLFVIVYDTRSDTSQCIEGSLLAEESAVEHYVSYDFSVSPENKGMGSKKYADFASSEVVEEVSAVVKSKNYVPIIKSTLRPILDKNNHGDSLALDTIYTNIDLFFSLIRKSAHREDLPILGMGVRYFSSYDACDECFKKIFDIRGSINQELVNYVPKGGYKIKNGDNFPFYSLFYSTRPYKESQYTVAWQYPESNKGYNYTLNPLYSFPKGQGIVYHPTYYFNFPEFEAPHAESFSKKSLKNLNLLRGSNELTPNFVYSYVKSFEPNDLPISFNITG